MIVEPDPTPEEAAAIMAALRARASESRDPVNRSRWRLAAVFGHAVPAGMRLEGSLWSYSSWEGMT